MHGSAIKEMTGEMERGNVARVEREEKEKKNEARMMDCDKKGWKNIVRPRLRSRINVRFLISR